jgi:hypothetical protein
MTSPNGELRIDGAGRENCSRLISLRDLIRM